MAFARLGSANAMPFYSAEGSGFFGGIFFLYSEGVTPRIRLNTLEKRSWSE